MTNEMVEVLKVAAIAPVLGFAVDRIYRYAMHRLDILGPKISKLEDRMDKIEAIDDLSEKLRRFGK